MQYKGYLIAFNKDFFKQIDYVVNTINSLILDQFLEFIKDIRLTTFILNNILYILGD